MDGLLYLGSIIAIGLVMHWVVLNDRLGSRDAAKGLLAMRGAPGAKPPLGASANAPSSGPPGSRYRRRRTSSDRRPHR